MAWIILAGITVVAGIVGGSIAAGLTFVFGLVGIIWYKIDCWEKARKQRKRERPPASSHGRKSGPRTARQGSQALTARDLYEERQPGSELQWIAPGERFSVGKFDLGGMVYTTSIEHDWAAEPSAINPKLKLAARAAPTDEALPYYSSYAQLPPAQRTAYLEWLQSGRRDGSPGERELGYIFLFFYGIERRVLVENDLDPSLIAEIAELLKHYGADRKSRSFKAYLSDFLHFASFRIGTESYRTLWPSYLPLHDGHFSETALTLILANVYTLGEPLHWSIAYRIAMHHKDSRRSVVVKRTGSRFFEMFQKRYEQAFPEGLPLKAGKREQQVDYRCANASLACLGSLPILTVPKVFGLKGQFKPLPKIWNECIEELSGYSRAVARANKDESISTKEALKIHLALPEALRKPEDHPLRQTFEAILADCPSEAGVHFLPVSLLQDAIELPERETLTLKQSEQVADLISSLGRRIAPDPRVLNIPLRRTQEVGVYVDESDAPPSELMPGLLRLLYLTALVAAADGSIDGEELSVFHDSVSELPLSSSDRQAFAATEAALFRDSNIALKNLNRIAKGIVESRRSEVIHLLVRVAGADDIITNDEHRILARICRAFGLDPSSVDELVANDPAFQTVAVVAKGKSKRRGEKIPPPPNSQAEEFSIDMDLVAAISEETKEVVSILSEVLTEDEPESPDSSATPQVSGAPTPQAPDSPEWLEELEPRFHSPLLELLGAEDTSADTVKAIVKKHHLMAGDLIDSVNAWADETLGDFLLEAGDDGSLTIYHDMIPA